jgi:hypothetical protein
MEHSPPSRPQSPQSPQSPIRVHITAKEFGCAQQTARETGVSLEEVLAKMVADRVRSRT